MNGWRRLCDEIRLEIPARSRTDLTDDVDPRWDCPSKQRARSISEVDR